MRLSCSFRCLATMLLLLTLGSTKAQQREIDALLDLGLENVKVVKSGDQSYISLRDERFRGVAYGVEEILQSLHSIDSMQTINLLIEENGVSKLAILSPAGGGAINASYNTEELHNKLKGAEKHNSSFGKLDIIFYPELYLKNLWFDRLYGVAINLSPAAQLSLWSGAELTAQVVIPLYTNMEDEKQYVRPGVIALSQSARLSNQLYGTLAVGNFTDDRMGVDATINYYTKSGRWNLGARAGLTGSSTFYGGEWVVSKWRRVTWSGWVSHYIPHYNLELTGQVMQMTYGDKGVQGSMRRYFGDVSVGLYAMLTDGDPNGGFTFSLPLPTARRTKRNRRVNVSYAEYFTRVYKSQSGLDNLTGFSYETSPTAGSMQRFDNPYYIESKLNE